MAEKFLRVKNLSVLFGKKKAVDNLNLEFTTGETVLIAGRNGAGKSTFLRSLGGLIIPDKGVIKYKGIKRDKIGIITDKMSLFNNMSLKEGIEFHSEIFGIESFDYSILENLELDLSRKISGLSSGQRAIYHLSLLISQKPELLLIDEVIYLIDPYLRDVFLDNLIGLIEESDTAVIMVNHTFSDTGRIPERVIIMDEGRIIIDEKREVLLGKVKKVFSDKPDKPDLPVFFTKSTPFGYEYFVYPFDERSKADKGFQVESIGLNEIIKAFLGGRYVKERD